MHGSRAHDGKRAGTQLRQAPRRYWDIGGDKITRKIKDTRLLWRFTRILVQLFIVALCISIFSSYLLVYT